MKPPAMPETKDMLTAAGIAAACALTMAVLLASVATPASKERIAAVETRADRAARMFRPARNVNAFGPDAVCARSPEAQAQVLRESLAGLAGESGVEVRGVDARPMTDGPAGGKLVPVRLKFEAVGSYESIVLLLDTLGRQRPEVFVDALDLTAKTSNVTLAFSGRVFCSA